MCFSLQFDDNFFFICRKLGEIFPFIDKKHVGIWGWSYGGFTSGMALAQDDLNVFKCAASVAPVTDWTYYGKISVGNAILLNFIPSNLSSPEDNHSKWNP